MDSAARKAEADGNFQLARVLAEHAFVSRPRVAGLVALAGVHAKLDPIMADEMYAVLLDPHAIGSQWLGENGEMMAPPSASELATARRKQKAAQRLIDGRDGGTDTEGEARAGALRAGRRRRRC